MGEKFCKTTPAIREKIKMLGQKGLTTAEIKEIYNYSEATISSIISGRWDEICARKRAAYAEYMKQDEPAAPAAEEEVQTALPLLPAVPQDAALLQHIAESIDYNNALMNGLLNMVNKLLHEIT